MIACKYRVLATLIHAAIKERGGRTTSELSALFGVTENHGRKVLRELSKAGYVGWVRQGYDYTWHLSCAVNDLREKQKVESKRARLERNRIYVIDYRARKKGGAEVSLEVTQSVCHAASRQVVVAAPNSVFALGAA